MKTTFPICYECKVIVFVLVVLLSSFKNSIEAQSCPGNLLTNPGFESDLNGWSNWGSLTISTDAYSGVKAANVPLGIESGGGNAVAATQGYTYNLNVFAKVTAPTTWATVEIVFYDASWNEIQNTYTQVSALNYQQYTVSAIAPYGTAWVSATLFKGAAGEMWADDFCLTTTGMTGTLSIGNLIYYDTNGNGKFDNGDWGINGEVAIKLYEDNNNDGIADGTAIASTTSSGGGYYSFTGLNPGSYFVQLENVPSWMFLIPKNGGDPDNDINNDNNGISQDIGAQIIKGGTITLTAGGEPGGINYNSSYDFALSKYNGLGDYVWLDANGNGIQETGETGMQNVSVKLINPSDNSVLETTQTDATGYYYFNDPYGKYGVTTYTVEFTTPSGYKPTLSNTSGNDEADSDPVNGKIMNVTVPVGTWNYSLDAGFVPDSWILPVKIVSFNAFLKKESKVDLKWQTGNEDNFHHFVIERGTDGKNFQEAGIVFAKGTQNGNADYTFTDNINQLQASVLYYRLRIVDFDNKTEFSDVRLIRLVDNTANTISLSAYPNPVLNELRVTIPESWQNQPVTYEIISVSGRLVKSLARTNANQTEVINVGMLHSGTYVIKASSNKETIFSKVIKY